MTVTGSTSKIEIPEQLRRFELPKDFTAEKREAMLHRLLLMYDFIEDLTKSVEAIDGVREREIVREIAERFTLQVRCATDIVVALYADVAFDGGFITEDTQSACARALRSVFEAMVRFTQDMERRLPRIPDKFVPMHITIFDKVALTIPN